MDRICSLQIGGLYLGWIMTKTLILARKILILLVGSLILAACAGKGREEGADIDTTPIELAPEEFKSKLSTTPEAVLVDVRKPEEVAEGMIDGAINIDYTDSNFAERIGTLDVTKPYFVYCKTAKRSTGAAEEMRKLGFEDVYVLEGGVNNWQKAGLEMVKPE